MKSLLSVLESPCDSRSKPTLLYIEKFIQDVTLIKEFGNVHGDQFISKLCQYLKGAFYQPTQIIISQNSSVDKLFILLEGAIIQTDSKTNLKQLIKTLDEKRNNKQMNLIKYSIINEKSSFAETHFVSKSPSTHYYIAYKECTVAFITITDFEKLLRSKNYIQIMQEIGEFSQIPFYQRLGISLLEQIILKSQIQTYSYKEIIYDIGQQTDAWYIIKAGEFGIQELIDKDNQSKKPEPPNNEQKKQGLRLLQDENFLLLEKIEQSYQPLEKLLATMVRTSGQHLREEIRFRILVRLTYGDFFGQQEILNQKPQRMQRVISLTNDSQVRVIQSSQFLQFCRHYPQFMEILKTIQSEKMENHIRQKQRSEHIFHKEWLADPFYFKDEHQKQISQKYQLREKKIDQNFVPLKRIKNFSCQQQNCHEVEIERKEFLDRLLTQHREKIQKYYDPRNHVKKSEIDPKLQLFLKSLQRPKTISRKYQQSSQSTSPNIFNSEYIRLTSNSLFRIKGPQTREPSVDKIQDTPTASAKGFFFSHRQSQSINYFVDVFQRVSDPSTKLIEESAASTTPEPANYIRTIQSRHQKQMQNVKNVKLMRKRYLL